MSKVCDELEQPSILTLNPLADSPVMSYDSVTSNVNRLAKCKNFTMFNKELAANTLPQWMFITPNMSKPPQPPELLTHQPKLTTSPLTSQRRPRLDHRRRRQVGARLADPAARQPQLQHRAHAGHPDL